MCLISGNKEIKKILHKSLDWKLINSLTCNAISKIHTINFLDKFAELYPNERNVSFWDISNAGFYDIQPLFISKDENSGFFEFESVLVGLVEISFTGFSGNIYMTDVELTTRYVIRIKNKNLIYYQTHFYPEEIGFVINYSKIKRVLL